MKVQRFRRSVVGVFATVIFLMLVSSIRAREKNPNLTGEKNANDGAEMILIPGGTFLMGSTELEVEQQLQESGLPAD